jgi:hypothetical protein
VFQFFIFILILSGAFWGSAFFLVLMKGLSKRLEAPRTGPVDALLREELESLAGRLERVEEELDFYKQLNAPEGQGGPPGLPAAEDQES